MQVDWKFLSCDGEGSSNSAPSSNKPSETKVSDDNQTKEFLVKN